MFPYQNTGCCYIKNTSFLSYLLHHSIYFYENCTLCPKLLVITRVAKVQRRAIRLINDPALTDKLPSLAHRRAVGDLSLFYRYFHDLCSDELNSIIPPVIRPSRQTRGASRLQSLAVSLTTLRTTHFDRTFVPRVSHDIIYAQLYWPQAELAIRLQHMHLSIPIVY